MHNTTFGVLGLMTTYTDPKYETIPIIVDSYKIWPVASIINFSFIPVDRRIVFLSTIGVLWGVYMSLVAASLN